MSSSESTYRKGAPSVEPKPAQAVPARVQAQSPAAPLSSVADTYKKPAPSVEPMHLYVIVSGGEVREKDYFSVIRNNQHIFKNIRIEFVADPDRLHPDGMLEVAKERMQHYKASEPEEPDRYYLVSDVDHFRNDLLRVKPQCEAIGAKLIVSNPCFEVWLYYSKRDDKFEGIQLSDNKLKWSGEIKNFPNAAIPGGVNPKRAIFDMEDNIRNSEKNYAEDGDGLPGLFSTAMHILASDIAQHIKAGLEQVLGTLAERRRMAASTPTGSKQESRLERKDL